MSIGIGSRDFKVCPAKRWEMNQGASRTRLKAAVNTLRGDLIKVVRCENGFNEERRYSGNGLDQYCRKSAFVSLLDPMVRIAREVRVMA